MTFNKKLTITKLKTGDIILQDFKHPNKYINWILSLQDKFDKGQFNHALIYYQDGQVLESNFDGVNFRDIDITKDEYVVLRHKKKISQAIMAQTISYYALHHQGTYSYQGLINASISALIAYVTGHKIQILKDKHQPYCSELVAEIYDQYGLPLNIDNDIITPNDLYRDNNLKVVD